MPERVAAEPIETVETAPPAILPAELRRAEAVPGPPPLRRPPAPRHATPALRTPLSFKLGIYAVLAAVACWPFRLRIGAARRARTAAVRRAPNPVALRPAPATPRGSERQLGPQSPSITRA